MAKKIDFYNLACRIEHYFPQIKDAMDLPLPIFVARLHAIDEIESFKHPNLSGGTDLEAAREEMYKELEDRIKKGDQ